MLATLVVKEGVEEEEGVGFWWWRRDGRGGEVRAG